MFDFDYNGGYTNEQLQYRDRMRRKQGQQWMQTGVIPGGLEEARRGGIEAPAPPSIRPVYMNPQSSGMQATPAYSRAEQEAQAANQIFDGNGNRVPEYVYGKPIQAGPETIPSTQAGGPALMNPANLAPEEWTDYNRQMAESGGDQGIFMRVGDGPAVFVPQRRNPRYDEARQAWLQEQVAMQEAKNPPVRPPNEFDALAKAAGTAGSIAGNVFTDPDARTTFQDIALRSLQALTNRQAQSGQAPPAWMQQQLGDCQAAPVPTPTPTPQRGGGIPMRGQRPQGIVAPQRGGGDVVVAEDASGSLVRAADGSHFFIKADGTRRPVDESRVAAYAATMGR